MFKRIRKWFYKYCILIIIFFLLSGFIFFCIGVYGVFAEDYYYVTIILPLGLGFTSVGLGILSIKTSYESDRKMIHIANEKVLDIERTFGDRRLDLLQRFILLEHKSYHLLDMGMDKDLRENKRFDLHIEWRDFNQTIAFNLWKAVTDIQRAEYLKKWTEDGYRNRLLIFTTNFFSNLLKYNSLGYKFTKENIESQLNRIPIR